MSRALLFPAGRYLINSMLTVDGYNGAVHLRGEGTAQSYIIAAQPMTAVLQMLAPAGRSFSNNRLEDLCLDAQTVANFSLYAPQLERSTISGVAFDGALRTGAFIGGWINTIRDSSFSHNGPVALHLQGSVNSFNVLDSYWEANQGIGILVVGGRTVRIEGNCLESVVGPAIVASEVSGLSIRSNYYEANGAGFHDVPGKQNGPAFQFVDDTGQPQKICAEVLLTGVSAQKQSALLNPYGSAPLLLGGNAPCRSVVVEGNTHFPSCGSASMCTSSGCGLRYIGVYAARATSGVAVRTNDVVCGGSKAPKQQCVPVATSTHDLSPDNFSKWGNTGWS